jgi:murein L,D-transpeptidase YafK
MVEPDALEKERESLEGIIEGWRRTWAEKEINGYMDFYSHRFTSGGKDWDGWRRYKEGLAKTYDQIDVDIDSLLLLKNEGVVLAKFNQLYHTLRFNSYGEKRLYLQRNSDEWKIVGEFFQLAKKLQPEPQKAPPPSTEEIRSFLSSWIKAWEEKDLNGYLSHYDPEFRSRGMDLEAWRVHRERLNRKYRALKIEISDLIIVKISDDTAKVSFKQDYRADGYRDFGLKKILLVKRSDHWKIKQEEWSPLRR